VISVSPVPDGPFGHDLRYGRLPARVNGFVHELGTPDVPSFHEFCTDVEEGWTSAVGDGASFRQPPIANISIRGRCEDVASVRSSE
jgi:hypothetical protein